MLNETDKREIKSSMESAEKLRESCRENEEKKSSNIKTKATSIEENQQTSLDYSLSEDPKKSLDYLANEIAEKLNISN